MIAPTPEYIKARVSVAENGCWIWTACMDRHGYGKSQLAGETLAHRVSYITFKGQIPSNLQLDHLCRNTACVNPEHLEPVTARENVLRGVSPAAINNAKTHCTHGHPLAGANVRIASRHGTPRRECMTCERRRTAAYKAKRRIACPQ